MVRELLIRFVLGGAIVSVFAALGELFQPKTFAGLFGSAPSVAIASLAMAFHGKSDAYAAVEARSMLAGALAMFAYGAACVWLAKQRRVPMWAGAGAAWAAWFAVAFGVFLAARTGGVL